MKNIFPGLLICMMLGIGCSTSSWSEEKKFSNHIWLFQDSLQIRPIIEDTSQVHASWLELTVNEEYPYQNIFIREEIITPSDSSSFRILEFILMNEDGTWKNKPGMTGKVHFRFPLMEGVKFTQTGEWKINCTQYMRTDTLAGVEYVSWQLN